MREFLLSQLRTKRGRWRVAQVEQVRHVCTRALSSSEETGGAQREP
ncbi:hypothetical protein DFR29_12436 [Tahibacter aquaticus]|uniref:Uncharacterized protein n=1 Tax=Tahibacter aquaticus TaxID=520092 RepID=A0A4R6YL22_9GAMM|nr:hypothetical protein DFR29_12436 [Tahibacter aquaticus]